MSVCFSLTSLAALTDFWNSFPWTMRILGFILLVVLGAANLVKEFLLNVDCCLKDIL